MFTFWKRNEILRAGNPNGSMIHIGMHCINLTIQFVNHAQYSIVLFGAYRRIARHQNDSFVCMSGNTIYRRMADDAHIHANRMRRTHTQIQHTTYTGTSFTNGWSGQRYTIYAYMRASSAFANIVPHKMTSVSVTNMFSANQHRVLGVATRSKAVERWKFIAVFNLCAALEEISRILKTQNYLVEKNQFAVCNSIFLNKFLNAKKKTTNKMREIVHIQAGQCGNQIGAKVSSLHPNIENIFFPFFFAFCCRCRWKSFFFFLFTIWKESKFSTNISGKRSFNFLCGLLQKDNWNI